MTDAPSYVQYGCGFSVADGWLNFDSSPTLRIERLPVIGPTLSTLIVRNGKQFPKEVVYGNIVKGLPLPDGSAAACYASHVLEHLSLQDMRVALVNTAKLLQPGGIFRMIVPDLLERARRYVVAANEGDALASHKFLESSYLGLAKRPANILQHVRLALGGSQHLWMWDEHSLRQELENAGFTATRRCEYGDSEDPMFTKVEEKTRFYDDAYEINECALEARIPP